MIYSQRSKQVPHWERARQREHIKIHHSGEDLRIRRALKELFTQCGYYDKIFSYKVKKLASVVEGDPKDPYSIDTSMGSRGGCYSLLQISPLYPWYNLTMLSVKEGGIKYHFLILWYDSTLDWTPVSRIIVEHSTHKAKPTIQSLVLLKRHS